MFAFVSGKQTDRFRISPHRDFSLFTIIQSDFRDSSDLRDPKSDGLLLANREGSQMNPAKAVKESRSV